MLHNEETRRASKRERVSEIVLSRNTSEDTASAPIFKQVAWVSSRYKVSNSVARLVAEQAFAGRPQR